MCVHLTVLSLVAWFEGNSAPVADLRPLDTALNAQLSHRGFCLRCANKANNDNEFTQTAGKVVLDQFQCPP
jgi:hypothetical protein